MSFMTLKEMFGLLYSILQENFYLAQEVII